MLKGYARVSRLIIRVFGVTSCEKVDRAVVAQAFLPAGFAVLSIRQAGMPASLKAAGKNACATYMPASLLQSQDDFGGQGVAINPPSGNLSTTLRMGKWGARDCREHAEACRRRNREFGQFGGFGKLVRPTNREFCQIGKFGFFGICGQSGQVGQFGLFDARDGCGVAGKLI